MATAAIRASAAAGQAADAITIAHVAFPHGGRSAVKRQDASAKRPDKVLLDRLLETFATHSFPYLARLRGQVPRWLRCRKQACRGLGCNPVQHRRSGSSPDGCADHIIVDRDPCEIIDADTEAGADETVQFMRSESPLPQWRQLAAADAMTRAHNLHMRWIDAFISIGYNSFEHYQ